MGTGRGSNPHLTFLTFGELYETKKEDFSTLCCREIHNKYTYHQEQHNMSWLFFVRFQVLLRSTDSCALAAKIPTQTKG